MNAKPVVNLLDELLKPLGFGRKKMTWNRRVNGFVDVVDLQQSNAGDALTVNVGVMHSEVHGICWGNIPPLFVEEPTCTVRSRIGQLRDGRDLWWRGEMEDVAPNVVALVRESVLPFLDQMHSPDAMAEHLERGVAINQKYPPPMIYLGILRWLGGDITIANSLLSGLRAETVAAWQKRIDEVLVRLRQTTAVRSRS